VQSPLGHVIVYRVLSVFSIQELDQPYRGRARIPSWLTGPDLVTEMARTGPPPDFGHGLAEAVPGRSRNLPGYPAQVDGRGTRVMTSYQLHMRRDSACPQQGTDVARIAGQHDVRWSDQQRYVRVDDIGRASPREQLAYPLAVIPAQ
jgi:hypothetical protein